MLVLFDIDGTLLLTHGEGMRAMQDAGRELYHPQFSIEGADFSGRLDPLIWEQLCEMNGVGAGDWNRREVTVGPGPSSLRSSGPASGSSGPASSVDDDHARFRAAYERHLRRRLDNGARVTVLPGVREVLAELRAVEGAVLGLVTGNYPETGRLKIGRAGIDFEMFTVFGWGCDGGHRRDLPRTAMAQCRALHKPGLRPEEAVIIGDTPHDIDCARHNGCRSIGVATGAFSMDELREHGADMVVAGLSDTRAVMTFILQDSSR